MREGYRQSAEHWNCFKGNVRGKRLRAHMGFSECIDTILNRNVLKSHSYYYYYYNELFSQTEWSPPPPPRPPPSQRWWWWGEGGVVWFYFITTWIDTLVFGYQHITMMKSLSQFKFSLSSGDRRPRMMVWSWAFPVGRDCDPGDCLENDSFSR